MRDFFWAAFEIVGTLFSFLALIICELVMVRIIVWLGNMILGGI